MKLKNKRIEDIVLLSKFHYGPINDGNALPALRFIIAAHLGLDPDGSTITDGVITGCVIEALRHYDPDPMAKIIAVAEIMADNPLQGMVSLFSKITLLPKDLTGSLPAPDEELAAGLNNYLHQVLRWVDK